MPPSVALEFDDGEVGRLVDGEQIDATLAVLPIPELFRNDEERGIDDVDVVSKQTLQIGTLADASVAVGTMLDRWIS